MRIIQLVTKRQYRGAELFAASLSTELINLGHEVAYVGLYGNEKDVLSVTNAENQDLILNKKSSFSIQVVKQLIRLIKNFKPDVIQCNGSDTLKYMVAASFFIEKVPILYRNISIISEWISEGPKKRLYKEMFRRISFVTSVGDEARADFIKTYDYPAIRTQVIRRGIPVKDIDEKNLNEILRQEIGLNPETKIALHIGNFSPEKNHEFLLDVFSDLKEENRNIKLICVGTGRLYEKIKDRIHQRGLENTIFLLGFRKDIPELLSASDCLVLSSKIEGVPGVILEAGTQRIPSVAINVGGVSEVLIDGKTGYLIHDFDKKEFKEKLTEIMMNDNLRHQMGQNAYEIISKGFDPHATARKFEELYRDLITSHKSNKLLKKEEKFKKS